MKRFKGVSLVEVIVYLAIFGVIFLTIIQFFIAMQQFNERTALRSGIQFETVFLSSHLEIEANRATSVNSAESIFNSANGVLTLETPSGSVEYSLVGGRVQVERGADSNFITSDRVNITNFRFEEVETPFDTVIGFRLDLDMNNVENPQISEAVSTSYIIND